MHARNHVVILLMCLLGWANYASADLVGWWQFDEDSGDVATDSSGHGLDAAIEGAAWTSGHSGSALIFNGVDSAVRLPARSVGPVQTVTAWVKVDAVESGQRQIFNGNGPPHMNFELQDGQIQGRMYTGSTNVTLTGPVVPVGVWTHVAWVYDSVMNRSELFIDGESVALGDAVNTIVHDSAGPTIGSHPSQTDRSFLGAIDDVRLYDHALTSGEIKMDMQGAAFSFGPDPEEAASDVLRDALLSWQPGKFASTHNVYFGTTFDDVNDATVPASAGQTVTSFDPGRLEFGQTYFWRVDEVNAAPDNTVYKGTVWSFTVEPYAIMVPVDVNAVTASSSTAANPAGLMVDGSGLDGSTHATDSDAMWLSEMPDMTPWLMFEFDSLQKLDRMLIWNSNSPSEGFVGWGIKDVNIEVSLDGVDWTTLAESTEVGQAPGQPTYSEPEAIDLNLVLAKYVRLNILSNWGGLLNQYGVAEVQFYGLPVYARTPDPASGATDVLPNSMVTWRAGREAGEHTVYVGTDADNLTSSVSSNTNSVDLAALDLQLNQAYHWRVDEVNAAEEPSVWTGDTWSFSTVPYLVVDDFESYSNLSPNRPFQTWLDGFGYSADEFFPVEYPGNGTGSGVGHDIWSPGSPQFDGQIMEGTLAKSGKSMPLYFNNTNGVSVSEAVRTFESAQDWTANGIESLSLNIYGDPGNTGQLYLKINGTRINYDGLSDALQRQQWIPWNIDLSGVAGLQTVTSLTIGIEGAGATGLIYVDDIRLYALTPKTIDPVLPSDSDPNLVAFYAFEGNANDSAGAHDGTATGDPGYAAGKYGQAMAFDGTDDNVTYALGQEEVWPVYSVSLWTRTEIFGQAQYKSVFNNNSSSSDFQIDVSGADPGDYRYWGSQGATIGPVTSDWVHLGVSCDGVQTRLYYNGLLVTVLDVADTRFGQLQIGINRGQNQPFAGSIDDVRIYNRALSDAELAGLAGVTQPVPTSFQ